MPRPLSKKKAEELKAFYNDESDSDDDLLQDTSHLQPSQSQRSPVSADGPLLLVPTSASSTETTCPVAAQQALEAKAKRIAERSTLVLVEKIKDPTLLRWHVTSRNMKRKISRVLPCVVEHCRMYLQDDNLTMQPNQELVRYLGHQTKSRNEYQIVYKSALLPFNGGGGGGEDDNDVGDGVVGQSQWSEKFMTMHIKAIQGQQAFRKDRDLQLAVERAVLDRMLATVVTRQAESAKQEAAQALVDAVDAADHDDASTDQEEQEKAPASPTRAPTLTPPATPLPNNAAVATETNANATSDAIDDTTTNNFDGSKANLKLRAGDVIQYQDPATCETDRFGTIHEVIPPREQAGRHDMALDLGGSMVLPNDANVKLLQRLLRGKLVHVPNVDTMPFYPVSAYTLVKSKLDASRHANVVGALYLEQRNDMQQTVKDYFAGNLLATGENGPAGNKGGDKEASGEASGDVENEDNEDDDDDDDAKSLPNFPLVKSTPDRKHSRLSMDSSTKTKVAAARCLTTLLHDSTNGTILDMNDTTVTKPAKTTAGKASKAKLKSRQPEPKAPTETKPMWIEDFQQRVTDLQTKRVRDTETRDVKIRAIQMAIRVRLRLEELEKQGQDRDELLDGLEDSFDIPSGRMRTFVNGDKNNLIKRADLKDLTDKFQVWIDGRDAKPAASGEEPSKVPAMAAMGPAVDSSPPKVCASVLDGSGIDAPPTFLVSTNQLGDMAADRKIEMETAKRKYEQVESALSVRLELDEDARREGKGLSVLVAELADRIQKPTSSLISFLDGGMEDASELAALCRQQRQVGATSCTGSADSTVAKKQRTDDS